MIGTAGDAVTLAIGLVGVMSLFLGLMKIAERAGLLLVVAKTLRPLMMRLFPAVPVDHPAMGAMIMNLSANILGLGNAATPFGISRDGTPGHVERREGESDGRDDPVLGHQHVECHAAAYRCHRLACCCGLIRSSWHRADDLVCDIGLHNSRDRHRKILCSYVRIKRAACYSG